MSLARGVLAPGLVNFLAQLFGEPGGCSLVAAVSVDSPGVVGHRPVGRLVFAETALFQPRERSTDCTLVEAGLGGNFARPERTIPVGSENSEKLVRDGEVREFLFARALEGVSIDGRR